LLIVFNSTVQMRRP